MEFSIKKQKLLKELKNRYTYKIINSKDSINLSHCSNNIIVSTTYDKKTNTYNERFYSRYNIENVCRTFLGVYKEKSYLTVDLIEGKNKVNVVYLYSI